MVPRNVKAAKPTSQTKRKAKSKLAPKPSASTSKKRPAQDSSSEMPYTSLASRKRRQPTCSMASLRNLENEVEIESNFVGLFGIQSDNHDTWGKTEAKPIAAIRRKGGKGSQLRLKQAAGFPRALFPWSHESSPEPIIPNSPDRSPILRLPLELRERIYAYLLLYKRPIILQPDWAVVEHKVYRRNHIVYVCKQINLEVTSFLYRRNAFRTILRAPPNTLYHHDTFSIPTKFLPLFKNVIITCECENYHLEWFEKASLSIKTLADANVSLDALTIVTLPRRVGLSDTAVGTENSPITFADFFYVEGQLMAQLKRLRCKVLNVVIKKVDGEENFRCFLVSVDLRFLHADAIEGNVVNEETVRIAKLKVEAVKKELKELKDRFEEVFLDDARAIAEGKCRLLDEE